MTPPPCSLCGEPVSENSVDSEDSLTDEHVPPKQFYPKAIRSELREGLWKVPSHRRCNKDYKLDEEYFYHYYYPLVGYLNGPMGKILFDDLRRRARKPQSKGLIRRLLRECTRSTPSGILLPPSLIRVHYNVM